MGYWRRVEELGFVLPSWWSVGGRRSAVEMFVSRPAGKMVVEYWLLVACLGGGSSRFCSFVVWLCFTDLVYTGLYCLMSLFYLV